ncbi:MULTISPECIES: YjbQ family protein [Enterococcus]|uniref:YjbQ family protein n=1 Tax=Enterococcus alishanensis TaxID=1303817 RepID=A0ABS6TH02_9ENTE|nr:YjbQ family protein [Enterococcus alishanensis]MBV7392181.1 YjbQ family protein [Enterococcus alishanensis]
MKIQHEQLLLETAAAKVTYLNMTDQIKEVIEKAGIKDGLCTITTPHTTCSVVFEEYVHDVDWKGDEFLHVDQNRILDKIIPRQLTESDYLYPGPKHVEFLVELAAEDPSYEADPVTILNADAHIKGSLFGASETIIIKDGVPQIGSVGYLYFIDWDQNRERTRKCNLLLMGE